MPKKKKPVREIDAIKKHISTIDMTPPPEEETEEELDEEVEDDDLDLEDIEEFEEELEDEEEEGEEEEVMEQSVEDAFNRFSDVSPKMDMLEDRINVRCDMILSMSESVVTTATDKKNVVTSLERIRKIFHKHREKQSK